jgi:CRP-like cAMP-binding protein
MWTARLHRKKTQWVVDEALLRTLTPLNLLGAAEIKDLITRSTVRKVEAGHGIGERGGTAPSTLYLLAGTVEIITDGETVTVVTAGTETAKHPLIRKPKSGHVAARAKDEVTVLDVGIDSDALLAQMNTSSEYEVSDIRSATDTDWLTRFLQAKVFMRLPPSNIRELLSRMEEIAVSAGQVIMRQGEADDYYYIVKQGRCRVTTKPSTGKGDVELAVLSEGDGFGEDALITNGRRGATVTMINDGSLMRLRKEDFTTLLVGPVLKYVTWEQAQSLLDSGAVLLDVRRPEEYQTDGIKGAINIPLPLLRSRADELDISRPHITVSNVLNRSSAAAFFLCQQGINATILKEGAHVPAARPQPMAGKVKSKNPPQVVPIRPNTALKKEEPNADLRKSLKAVQLELERERENKKAADNQISTLNTELQRIRRARAADDNLKTELATLKGELAGEIERRKGLESRLEAKDAELRRIDQLTDTEAKLNERLAAITDDLDRERSVKRELERQMTARGDELRHLRQEREADAALKEEVSRLRYDLGRESGRARDMEEQVAAMTEELHQLRDVRASDDNLKTELEAMRADLAAAMEQRHELKGRLTQKTEELQRLQRVQEVDDELRSELSSVKRSLEREAEMRKNAEDRLGAQGEELRRLRRAQDADSDLKVELVAARRRLERELEINKVIEKQLERQREEIQRLQDESETGDEVAAEITAVKEELIGEKAHRHEVEKQVTVLTEAQDRLKHQLNKFRRRLKKVVSLARVADEKRRAAEAQASSAAIELEAARQDMGVRSLRLAEVELERRKLERTVSALQGQIPGGRPVFIRAEDDGVDAAPSGAANVSDFSDAATGDSRMVLRLPSPRNDAEAPQHSHHLRRIQRFVARALIWIILVGVAILSLYGVAVTGAFKVKAAPGDEAAVEQHGLLSSISSYPLKLPFASSPASQADNTPGTSGDAVGATAEKPAAVATPSLPPRVDPVK